MIMIGVINFGEYFKPAREKLYSKLSEKQNLIKVAKSFKIFLTTPVEMMQSSSSDNCICHYNIRI